MLKATTIQNLCSYPTPFKAWQGIWGQVWHLFSWFKHLEFICLRILQNYFYCYLACLLVLPNWC